MSAAKKKEMPYSFPTRAEADTQASLRQVKIKAEQLREKLQKSIIDNPQMAKKAALLISIWLDRGKKKTKNSR